MEGILSVEIAGKLNAHGIKCAIIASKWNDFVVNRLLSGAVDTLKQLGGQPDDCTIYRVPGSFEIPFIARKVALTGKWDILICLGAIVRGDTPHFDYLAAEVTKGIAMVSLETGIPIAYGILTTDTVEQAVNRAGMKSGNKGAEAAMSAIELFNLCQEI